MKIRLLSVPVLLALVASLAACGGSQNVPASAVAVVNGTPITIAQFNDFFAQGLAQAKATGQPASPGTPQYTALRTSTVSELVSIAELKQQAAKNGVSVSQSDVTKFLANLVQTQYHGSQAKFQAALKTAGMTTQSARDRVLINLLATKLQAKVTSSAKVTTAEEKAYYNSPSYAPTRSVEHILVKSKSLADSLEQQLKNGASFAKLAKKYSKDPGSAAQGGKYTATKGREVPAYDAVAFTLKTGQLSAPVDATSAADGGYGWFIIKALGPVPTFSEAQATIQSTLLQQKQQTLWQQWVSDMQNTYKGKVRYQSGYAPPTTTAGATIAPPTTTG